ncbi:hypothetical protein C9374_014421 [Naegleria lovaniensis]|uniref:Carboxylic ester hydrolase n=1 Tax=Naegleria lovaniensis TaxID=51637 RepID=A0AA88KPV7_NAELO|nr:uncharacterized protein C9374_014421 [Naegleria lovaniensis]KAG2389021.1 hypothetical protein C9374_014421 [Naegleria lovaniensis]
MSQTHSLVNNTLPILLLLVFLFIHTVSTSADEEVIVRAPIGTYQGFISQFTEYQATARAFTGIRYAQAPVGSLRWKPTQPVNPFSGIYNANIETPGCPQRCELPPHTCPKTQSEDCLFLNLYTPRLGAIPKDQLLPVYVFFPGGHFEQGTPNSILYDGTFIANKTSIVMVIAGYRLGALGWLANANAQMSGNYGFMDQLTVLKWVQNNIAAFGGDPKRVTIGGQSAGATSTTAHLISPASKGLFHQVIVESNPLVLPMRLMDDVTINLATPFAKQVGCDVSDFSCFQNLSIDSILQAQYYMDSYKNLSIPLETFLPWAPTVASFDKLIPYQTFEAVQKGYYHKVPMIFGNVAEEALIFIYMGIKKKMTTLDYVALLYAVFGIEDGARVLNWYRPLLDGDKRPEVSIMGTDYIFLCPLRNVLSQITTQNPQLPVYNFIFNHVLTFDAWGPKYTYCVGHVCHGAELPFVFHSLGVHTLPDMHFSPQEDVLSTSIVNYFTNFVKFGNPNGNSTSSVTWPQFSANNRQTMMFQTPANQLVKDYKKSYCDEWDYIGYDHGWLNQLIDQLKKN